jgi:hypothetical protein
MRRRDELTEGASIESCDGYKKLLAVVERDEKTQPGFHDYRAKLKWVLDRASQYASATGLDAAQILDAWERRRDYWYMNFYQEANQPEMTGGRVRVFETTADLLQSIGKGGFRCPACDGISQSPYVCDSGRPIPGSNKICDWKAYGLLGTLGKGASIFVKERLAGETIFMPIAWEGDETRAAEPTFDGSARELVGVEPS